ncbi:MAG: WecB/TagA/CpsF family glycosyltransferase, partial [Pseudomonadota bacterium]
IARRGAGNRPQGALPARLWQVAAGNLAFVGPTDTAAHTDAKPGLVSPAALRARMGIAHTGTRDGDAQFFATASGLERTALVVRYAWACVVSTSGSDGQDTVRLLGVRIDALSMSSAVGKIMEACDSPERKRMELVSFVNPDCLNTAMRDRDYHYLLNQSNLVLPDGSGLRIAGKLLGLPLSDNVNGTDLFPLLCEQAAQAGKKLFLYGGRPGVAVEAARRMCARFPGLDIVGCVDGYASEHSAFDVVHAINASGADIVLVGLGAPRQERWLTTHRALLNAAVGIGVGGLFDYYSGRIRRAPLWLRELGMEWVWRILQEPRAKWRRYVFGNPLFIARILKEQWLRRQLPTEKSGERLPMPGEWAAYNAAAATEDRPPKAVSRRWQRLLAARIATKRLLDVSLAGLALLVLSPLLLATAALIRIESPGPVFFKQVRVGLRGREFPMYKFRSMYMDAERRLAELADRNESEGGVLFKMKKDPRITRVGKTIRRFSIDELPQLVNVLRGEMSIVGPRPALPSEVQNYTAADRKRLQAKPGLTCLWQIGGRSDLSFAQQVKLDIEYLRRRNALTDIGIMAQTVPAVISGKGAY